MGRFLVLIAALLLVGWTDAFSISSSATTVSRLSVVSSFQSIRRGQARPFIVLNMAQEQRDASRSGTKRDRLDKLAELEDSRVDTDKGFVVKAAGAFVGLLAILLLVAFATVEGPI